MGLAGFLRFLNRSLEKLERMLSRDFVSVVIPAYNEEATIRRVIETAKDADTDEIIVVDDGSKDRTSRIAAKAGARVIKHSKNMGKGAAMSTGVENSRGNMIVFLDADLRSLTPASINRLIRPLKDDDADFVKSYYSQYRSKTGTSFFLYRPLLRKLFNNIDFTHPVSGQISGRRSFFERIEFRDDYGTDISILLDAVKQKQRVKEFLVVRT